MKILICGLPGSGKTTLAKKIVEDLKLININDWIIIDQVAGTRKERQEINADAVIWIDTVPMVDTNFQKPTKFMYRIKEHSDFPWSTYIIESIIKIKEQDHV